MFSFLKTRAGDRSSLVICLWSHFVRQVFCDAFFSGRIKIQYKGAHVNVENSPHPPNQLQELHKIAFQCSRLERNKKDIQKRGHASSVLKTVLFKIFIRFKNQKLRAAECDPKNGLLRAMGESCPGEQIGWNFHSD